MRFSIKEVNLPTSGELSLIEEFGSGADGLIVPQRMVSAFADALFVGLWDCFAWLGAEACGLERDSGQTEALISARSFSICPRR